MKGLTYMTGSMAARLEHMGVVVHRDGAITVRGARPAPPKLTSQEPIETRIAALEVRLRKGGVWLDAEQAWLDANVDHADRQQREAELDRQLTRWAMLLDELSALERERDRQLAAASSPEESATLADASIAAITSGKPWPLWVYDRAYDTQESAAEQPPAALLPADIDRVLAVALPLRVADPPKRGEGISRYANKRPTWPCRVCGGDAWVKWETPAGLNWRCATCHEKGATKAEAQRVESLG